MEPGPSSEVNWTASQESLRTLWNAKVYHRIYKSPLPVPTLSHNNEVYASPSHVFIIRLNITPRLLLHLPSGPFPHVSTPKPCKHSPSLSPMRATCPAHRIFLNLITRIIFWWWVQTNTRRSPHYPFFTHPLLPPRLRQNTYSSAPYSQTLWARTPPSLSEHLKGCKS
jgi:hypothetical protein